MTSLNKKQLELMKNAFEAYNQFRDNLGPDAKQKNVAMYWGDKITPVMCLLYKEYRTDTHPYKGFDVYLGLDDDTIVGLIYNDEGIIFARYRSPFLAHDVTIEEALEDGCQELIKRFNEKLKTNHGDE